MNSSKFSVSFLGIVIFATFLIGFNKCYSQPDTLFVNFEVVSDSAATGDGGNAWGGHQCRIVRTSDGVFTAYTVEGDGYLAREWRLAQRTLHGWEIIASGTAGREPVNLLASPDGTLHVIGWPEGNATMWSLSRIGKSWDVHQERIPGLLQGFWPYNSAGIDSVGNICVLSSEGGSEPEGAFRWAYFNAATQVWTHKKTLLDYRYCYTYVFPQSRGGLSLVATRDVRWEALGYQKPSDAFDYVFNAFRYWHTDAVESPLAELAFVQEPPTEDFPLVWCNAQLDAYLDTRGNMHVLYFKKGATTSGRWQHRHAVFSPLGEKLFDGELPPATGWYCRIFQSQTERYFLLGDAGMIYRLAKDGFTPTDSIRFALQGYRVEYSGFGVSVPRTGTPLSNVVDVVFPTNSGKNWIYFSLPLDKLFAETSVQSHQPAIDQFALSQNYPNPFNAETVIRYEVQRPTHIKIEIYNTFGQIIAIPVDAYQTPGEYTVKWNGTNMQGQVVTSGVYLVRFRGDNFVNGKKILFLQ